MTTPDTSAVRAWAKENGYEVAGRGRLPAEVTDAYLAAHGKKKPAPAKKAAPAKKVAAAKAAPARRTAVKNVAAEQAAPVRELAPEAPTPQPKPSLVSDDRRLVALGEEIKALTARVEALEQAAGGKSGTSKARFRRRS